MNAAKCGKMPNMTFQVFVAMATKSTDFDTQLFVHKCHMCVHAAVKFRLSSSFQLRIMDAENGNKHFETPCI